jgi:ankyrin repeat protein
MGYDLHALIRENKIDALKEAIEKGADINVQDEYGNTLLILALNEEEANDETIECLLDYKSMVTITNNSRITALHAAIIRNNNKFIRVLVERGADINAQDEEGNTPLILALLCNEEEVKDETIECLIDCNSKIMIANKDGTTPLHAAVFRNNIKFIKALIERGADINARDEFQATPLLYTLEYNRRCDDIPVIACLLQNGADINARDKYDKTVLHHAVEDLYKKYNTLTLIEYLLQSGADINAQDEDGFTPFMIAVYNIAYNETHIALLLQYNSDVTIKDKRGRMAVSYLSKRNDLSDSIKGKLLSLCLLEDPRMQCLKSEGFQGGFCKNTSLPTELYLDIVDHAKSYILEDIAPEIPLQDKLNWLKAYKEETRRKRQEQASEAEEQTLPCEIRCRP